MNGTTHSKCDRVRRNKQTNCLPFSYRDRFVRFAEFPKGIFVDSKGIPHPDQVPDEDDDDDEETDLESVCSRDLVEALDQFSDDGEVEGVVDQSQKLNRRLRELRQLLKERREDREEDEACKRSDYVEEEGVVIDDDYRSLVQKGDEDYVPSLESEGEDEMDAEDDLTSSEVEEDEEEEEGDYSFEDDSEGASEAEFTPPKRESRKNIAFREPSPKRVKVAVAPAVSDVTTLDVCV